METTSSTTANQVKNAFEQRILSTDSWRGEAHKNIDFDYGRGVMGSSISWWGSATYLFERDAKGQSIYNWILANIPAGVTKAFISLHFCPVEGAIPTGWQGCHNDSRADYQETTVPAVP